MRLRGVAQLYWKVLRQYATFAGRASRREFWTFVLVSALVAFGCRLVDHALGLTIASQFGRGPITSLYMLVVFCPTLAVAVRRMHDLGKSGWFLVAAGIPAIGALLLIYWYLQSGERGNNAYGPSPTARLAA